MWFLGAALKILEGSNYIDWSEIKNFVLTTQDPITGGNTYCITLLSVGTSYIFFYFHTLSLQNIFQKDILGKFFSSIDFIFVCIKRKFWSLMK